MAFATCPTNFQEFSVELDKFLHGENLGLLKDVFQKIERDFEIRRLNIALGFLACLTVVFLASDGAHFLCNFIGFAYPACVIILAIEQGRAQLDNRKWLTYWAIYNAFSFIENLLPLDIFLWRSYALAKCALLVIHFLPVPWNASEKLYIDYINPFLQSHHTTITEGASQIWEGTNKGAAGFVLLYLAYMWGFRFLCNVLGFLYPAYISMVCVMVESEIDGMYLLAYWVLYSGCTLFECLLSAIPLYYPAKFILLGIYMLEPMARQALYQCGQHLVLCYKPVSGTKRFCRNIVHLFMTPHPGAQRVRVNQVKRYPAGILSLRSIALRKTQDTAVKAQHLGVDPQEVNLVLSSPMVQAVLEMDVDVELVKKAIMLKLARDGTGHNFTCAEELLEAVFELYASHGIEEEGSDVDRIVYPDSYKNLLKIPQSILRGADSQNPLEVIEENRQLKDQRMCKICMTEEVEMVFVPCGHLVCCNNCAEVMDTCPICRTDIESSLRAYMS